MKLGTTRIDPEAVKAGVWTTFVIQRTGDKIKLRLALADASMNQTYQKALRTAMAEHDSAISVYKRASDMPAKMVEDINRVGREVFVRTIITDWDGFEAADGKKLQYTPEGAAALFDEFPELYKDVEGEAKNYERYRVAVLEAQAGNSQPA